MDYRKSRNGDVKQIHLKADRLTDEETEKLAGTLLGEDSFDQLVNYDADIFKPNGEILAKIRYNILTRDECEKSYGVWQDASVLTDNRGLAAGNINNETELRETLQQYAKTQGVARLGKSRIRLVKKDGRVSNSTRAKRVFSGIVGFFDRSTRFPYCRLTAYNLNHPRRFTSVIPFVRAIDKEFKTLLPQRHAAQMQFVEKTSDDFYIHGTSFTTVTVNKNFQTAVHKDVGDLKQGFGVMTCLRSGRYNGCYFVFPKWKIAIDMQSGCVLCADVHEWHGNSPMKGNAGMFERVSLVLYYRERMFECGAAVQEHERAKRLRKVS